MSPDPRRSARRAERRAVAALGGGITLSILGASAAAAQPLELFRFHGPPGAYLGAAVDGAGDVDGDGHADLVVGATDGNGLGDEPGTALVFSGASGALLRVFVGDFDGDAFGTAVAGVGDVDDDGFDDVAVGARYSHHQGIFSGTVKVFSGRDGAVLFAVHGDEEGDRLGYSVDGAGDVDGDGLPDVIAGAIFDSNRGFWSGSARVFSGRDGSILHHFDGVREFDLFGTAVAGAGDVDGDGFADVIVGAPDNGSGGFDAGMARVFSGRDGTIIHTFLGDSIAEQLGQSVAGAGDVDGDGLDDLIVGAYGDDDGGIDSGSAFVFSGADGALLHAFHGDSAGDELGFTVAGAGDVDGDGIPDIWAGAPFDGAAGDEAGSASLFSGRDGSLLFSVLGAAAGAHLGVAVGGAGDVDQDGFPDLIAGANHDPSGGLDAGSAVVISGGVTLQAPDPGIAGGVSDFRLTRATAGGLVAVAMARTAGATTREVPGCGRVTFALDAPLVLLGTAAADPAGQATVSRRLPPGLAGHTVAFQAIDRRSCRVSNLVVYTFP